MSTDLPKYIPVPTSTRGMRAKPQKNWKEEIKVVQARDNRGHPSDGYMINVPLEKNLGMVFHSQLDLVGRTGEEVSIELDVNAKKLGWSAFDEKMFDACVFFADRHPDRNGSFVYAPAAFGRLLFPGRSRLGKRDYNRMHFAIAKFMEQRYNITLTDSYEIEGFRVIADYGSVYKKDILVIQNGRKETVKGYVGGLFQIYAGIWKEIKNWKQLAFVEMKALGLPDRLYPINRAIKFFARTNWNKQKIKEKGYFRMGLNTLIKWSNIAISPSNEKKSIARLHMNLDELVESGMLVEWWIVGASGGGHVSKEWLKETRLVEKRIDNTGKAVFSTRWERMDKTYCFRLTDEYISLCQIKRKKPGRINRTRAS